VRLEPDIPRALTWPASLALCKKRPRLQSPGKASPSASEDVDWMLQEPDLEILSRPGFKQRSASEAAEVESACPCEDDEDSRFRVALDLFGAPLDQYGFDETILSASAECSSSFEEKAIEPQRQRAGRARRNDLCCPEGIPCRPCDRFGVESWDKNFIA